MSFASQREVKKKSRKSNRPQDPRTATTTNFVTAKRQEQHELDKALSTIVTVNKARSEVDDAISKARRALQAVRVSNECVRVIYIATSNPRIKTWSWRLASSLSQRELDSMK